jgi:hypothetical protein
MLRQEELAFIKAVSTMQLSPAILKELRTALATSKKKRKTVVSGSHGTTLGGGPKSFLRPPSLNASKRKANEHANSGGSTEPANRRPAPGAGPVPLPAFTSVTGEQAALGSRQLGPPVGGVTYAAALVRPIAPSQPSGALMPTAMDSDMSESAVPFETANRRMSTDMSGPLSDIPDGATLNAQLANTCLPAGDRPNKTPIFISGVCDTRAFLVWLRASCRGGLTADGPGRGVLSRLTLLHPYYKSPFPAGHRSSRAA